MRMAVERHCLFCGKAFLTVGVGEYCNRLHQAKQWRARTMLAGTHGYDKRSGRFRFVRVQHLAVKRGRTHVCGLCGTAWPCLPAQHLEAMNEDSRASLGDTEDRRESE